MKYPLLIAVLLSHLSSPLSAASIENGHTTEQVIEALGKPMGTIELREKTLLLYPQGEITLKNDLVTEVDLMSPEKFADDQERLRLEREEWLIDQERRQAAQIKEGIAIRADKMTSRAFAVLPAKDRVDYWRGFQIRYPGVDVTQEISTALASYEIELEELRSQQRIAELEARVAHAEQEAATARLETEKLREETELSEREQNYGLRYYSDPVINNSRYYYRPPTVTIFTSGNGKTTTYRHDAPSTNRHNNPYSKHHNGTDRSGSSNNQNESVAERVTRILNQTR
ncbi:hypothetical protein ACWPKS_11945 [Coraliomargarita sp. W4R72]